MAKVSVLIFARYPQPGAVKTRMVPPLTHEEAAALHTASLLAVCEGLGALTGHDVVVVGTPDERVKDLGNLVADSVMDSWPQGDGDLGQRLLRASDRAFDIGAAGVVLLGADSPTLPRDLLAKAIASLAQHDAAMGPTDDGGYYLLAMRRRMPELFEAIDWGTQEVATQTRQRAAAAGLDLFELPAWYDIDRFADLVRAAKDLARMSDDQMPRTRDLRDLVTRLIERNDHGGAHSTEP